MQRPMRQAGGDVFGGRRLLARGGGIDSAGSMWGLVGQGRKPEAQQQRPVQPVRPPPPLVRPEGELWRHGSGGLLEDHLGKQAAQAPGTARVSPGWLSVRALTGAAWLGPESTGVAECMRSLYKRGLTVMSGPAQSWVYLHVLW